MPDEVLAGLSVPEREQLWSDRLSAQEARTSVVVATDARRVVGVAAAGPPMDPTDRADSTLGELYALYLDPDRWGRPIGIPLHAAALGRLVTHSFTHAGLWVLDGNQRALRFYLRHGWTDTGRTQIDRERTSSAHTRYVSEICRRGTASEQGPHVGDIVFGHRHRQHRRAVLERRPVAAEGIESRLRLPALEDVDAAGVDQVGGDGDVEAAGGLACLFDDDHAAREVGLALLRLDGDVSGNDDDG